VRCHLRLLTTAEGGRDTPLRSGWRGLVSFGELWTEDDAPLWPDHRATLPVGKEMRYGCELRIVDPDVETLAPGEEAHVDLVFWAIADPRPAMHRDATFSLREGATEIAVGTVLGVDTIFG
jgi:hypothetical protein